MNNKLTIKEIVVRIAERSGATKKISGDILKALPELIESALERDGEVRIAGLGAFKLKWVKARRARNLKTGETVEVPAHNKVVFYPEKGLRDRVNKDYKYLTYTVLEDESVGQSDKKEEKKEAVSPQLSSTESASDISSVVSQPEKEEKVEQPARADTENTKEEEPDYRKRKLIWWIIPLVFIIIALLIVIFYMRNCQDELTFQKKDSEEQVIKPAGPAPGEEEVVTSDTTSKPVSESEKETPPPKKIEEVTKPEPQGFKEQRYILSQGKYLFQVARETYGNPFLWVLIYKENLAKIRNPEEVVKGTELVIPALEGTPYALTSSDSSRVAEGNRLLYEYYSSKGDERAADFRFAMERYTPR